jgi:hypothetical protein
MGTRGAWGFVLAGSEKIMYNHYDSYPRGLGQTVLDWLREQITDEIALRERVEKLTVVPDREPTPAEQRRFAKYSDSMVSTGRDWYALLRHTQGNMDATLEAGLFEDGSKFPLDSLFCEWAYIIDLDMRQFEVYEGFRTEPTTDGRWKGQREAGNREYHAIQLVASYSFDELPELDLDIALTALGVEA